MASRARTVWFWLDSEGRPIPGATVSIRNAANSAQISDTVYAADDPDTAQLTNGSFTSAADGRIEFYLVTPQRVTLRLSKSGYTSQDIPVDVTFVANRFTWRGAFSALTTYAQDDVVSNANASWVALRASTGVTPVEGADWSKMAAGTGIAETLIDAAGDLIYGSGADAATRLPIGTANQLLRVNAGATAPEWTGFLGARAFRLESNQSLTSGSATAVGLNGESFDSSALHDTATNNSRILLNRVGKWRVHAQVEFAPSATGVRTVAIRKNGATSLGANVQGAPSGTQDTFVQVSDIVESGATTDYIEVLATQTSGGALNVVPGTSGTYVTVDYLGP